MYFRFLSGYFINCLSHFIWITSTINMRIHSSQLDSHKYIRRQTPLSGEWLPTRSNICGKIAEHTRYVNSKRFTSILNASVINSSAPFDRINRTIRQTHIARN
jgi:hypothetical protein